MICRNQLARRRGYTLLELVVALTASSFLLAGIGSSLFLAGQFVATTNSSARGLEATDALHQLTEELRYATHVLSRGPRHLQFVVNDITGDGDPDHLAYP